MTTKSMLNKFSRLKGKIHSVKEDIKFLRACKKNKVMPSFIKVTAAVSNYRSTQAIKCAQSTWLTLEIKHLFRLLAEYDLESYNLHLSLTKGLNCVEMEAWHEFSKVVFERVQAKVNKKRLTQKKKLNLLLGKKEISEKQPPELIPDFVVNESIETFNEAELNLLNKGLKYTPKPNAINFVDAVVDIESIIKYKTNSVQNTIRDKTANVIRSIPSARENKNNEFDLIKNIKEKNCVYVKADKGNKLVILGKEDYEFRMTNVIDELTCKQITRNPLPKMVRESDELRKKVSEKFGLRYKWSLNVSNPTVAKLYGLPKIHKVGNKMRPIVSSINTPSYKLAKWFMSEMKKLPRIKSLSVLNSFELVEKLKDVRIDDDEVMISFDVTALFPSVPIERALAALKRHFIMANVQTEERLIYEKVAKLCLAHSFFQFRDKFYQVTEGTNMGNPISPFAAELVMAELELYLKEKGLLPRVWWRYVDDIYSIVKRSDIYKILDILNSQIDSIKFTHEVEQNNEIAFLDLMIKRVEGKLSFAVHHKPTSTMRTITSDSFCPIQHKQAAFHSMIHRLCRLPLSASDYKSEYEYIMNVARSNGYTSTMIDTMIRKHSKKVTQRNCSTFYGLKNDTEEKKKVAMSFVPQIANKLHKKFNECNMQIVFKNNNKMSSLLGSTKDKIETIDKCGIYSVSCGDCDSVYYGQTKRSIGRRFKEHSSYIKKNECRKSALAEHVLAEGHFNVDVTNLKLVKHVHDERLLDAYESYYITNDQNALNKDNGNIDSYLFTYRQLRRQQPRIDTISRDADDGST